MNPFNMKPEWEQFVKEQKPAKKPVVRSEQQFIKLPGKQPPGKPLKRKTGRYGGSDVEKGRQGYGKEGYTRDEVERFNRKKLPPAEESAEISQQPDLSFEELENKKRMEEVTVPEGKESPKMKIGKMAETHSAIEEERRREIARVNKIRRRK